MCSGGREVARVVWGQLWAAFTPEGLRGRCRSRVGESWRSAGEDPERNRLKQQPGFPAPIVTDTESPAGGGERERRLKPGDFLLPTPKFLEESLETPPKTPHPPASIPLQLLPFPAAKRTKPTSRQ